MNKVYAMSKEVEQALTCHKINIYECIRYSISIKTKEGVYKNYYTLSIDDETNEYGQNITYVSRSRQKSKDEAEVQKENTSAMAKVFWTDGKINAS